MAQDNKHKVREMTDADRQVIAYMRELESKSLDTLEAAGRQIITLVTSLLGLFLGILAFKDNPAYLAYTDVKLLGALAGGGMLVALLFSLGVVIPRQYNPQDLGEIRRALQTMIQVKKQALYGASLAFGLSIVLLVALLLDLLLFRL
jgi:hypothetical protein